MTILFWLSFFVIFYIYIGYLATLKLFMVLVSKNEKPVNARFTNEFTPIVSIIGAAYNEERVIKQRIENLLTLDYPKDKLEIIIASDGSTDKTVEITKMYENQALKVLDFKVTRGRAAIHNDAIKVATWDIVVFTDLNTNFDKNFLKNIVNYFSDETVGCVVGNLIYNSRETSICESEGFYWKFEKQLRKLESNLGFLATATGACMALRKKLWRDLAPIDDVDFTTPLDVVLQGHKVIFANDAIAYDNPPLSISGELKARIRMTSKNLIGTLKRWGVKGWIEHPVISWGLLSHKIFRWFTPFFLLSIFISNIFLLKESWFHNFIFGGQIVFYLLALVGFIGELNKKRIPVAFMIFSFCIANIGMGIGVIKGLIGRAPTVYKMLD